MKQKSAFADFAVMQPSRAIITAGKRHLLGPLAACCLLLQATESRSIATDFAHEFLGAASPSSDVVGAEASLELPLPGDRLSVDRSFARSARALYFERNDGQTTAAVRYLARGPGYRLFITPTGAVVGLSEPESRAPTSAIQMYLTGSNPTALVLGEESLRAKANYFIGNEPSLWWTNIPTFGKVRLQEIYPGVDLVFYGREGELEYDFVVAPGADPSRIAMQIEGADKTEVDRQSGDLVLNAGGREMRWRKPLIYQELEGVRHEIAGTYRLDDGMATYRVPNTHQISFDLTAYDPSRVLVIDPVLVYSTYFGGGGEESASGVAADADGNAYITGNTSSIDFPTKSALNSTMAGTDDAFVAKFSPKGELIYSTYLGGSGTNEWGQTMAVDAAGTCYLTGSTSSTNFPLTHPTQAVPGGKADGFITAIKPDGSALLFSSYLGGDKNDHPSGVALDQSGNIYVAGQTFSASFPILNAFQSVKGAALGADGFVTKLESGGKRILYSTYFGGSSGDTIASLAVDPEGNAYIAGLTYSSDLPVKNAAQPELRGSDFYPSDFFYAKLNADGTDLFFSSYFGGYGIELDSSIAVGQNGTFALAGWTTSDGLSSVAPSQGTFLGSADTIVAQFNATDGTLIASTYLGGNDLDKSNGVALDKAGDIYVVGTTASSDFPISRPLQASYNGTYDIFLTKLNVDDLSIAFSTYFGGMGNESQYGAGKIALDGQGNVFITGRTTSTKGFPLLNSLQSNRKGGQDAFIAKLSMAEVLSMNRSGQTLVFSWPASAIGYQLETTTTLGSAAVWEKVVTPPVALGDQQTVAVDVTAPAQFFRLRK